ncbi:MAG: MMPL family transporter [Halapricum sp.]
MSAVDRIVGAVTEHTKLAIAVMVILTVIVGAGAGSVQQKSSLEAFQSDTPQAQASNYITENFSTGPENTTFVQVIVRGDNVLSKDSLIGSLQYQQRIKAKPKINETLVEANRTAGTTPTFGVANVLAQAAISQQQFRQAQQTLAQYPFLNVSGEPSPELLARIGAQLQQRKTALNQTGLGIGQGLQTLARDRNASIQAVFEQTNANTPVELDQEDYQKFRTAAQRVRNATSAQERKAAIENGPKLVLADEGQTLQEAAGTFQEVRQQLETRTSPSLQTQIDTIQNLSSQQLDGLIQSVLGGNSTVSSQALRFMPVKGYEPGSTTANATAIYVTQRTSVESVGGTATQKITDSQLAMQDVADQMSDGQHYLVFGSGIISHEIDQSMSDSMVIIGPLALLFVLIALILGYRDLLDIVLGLLGIFAVLIWTFGFMGWVGINFNQIFIAVPVLLIGLSIDYAIHIFMRHREERFEMGNGDLRGSMKVALAGVGVALALVTLTTVFGFLSNLVSPLPPIKDFGIVSSFGIIAAFLIFGVLAPALKIEIDEFLEARGFDRKKRAIGTGGGRLGQILEIGSTGARRSAVAIIVVALILTAAGAYGASQVDTSFNQKDFLANDPPGWMKDLPGPFAPGTYTAKDNLAYVNSHFRREDSQASILIKGDVATSGALDRMQRAQSDVASKNVTQRYSSGTPAVQTPLTVLNATRRDNTEFDALVAQADTDSDGLPEQNISGIYDALFRFAPQDAGQVLNRADSGSYTAARFVVNIKGTASGSETTDQMQAVASNLDGNGLTVIATGQSILFEIVQQQLLDTVIESLLITLITIIVFLMIVYRITDGSATLGFVTLIPVVLSVAWILGTMYLFGIPFNVLTGMITSLTVGLGVAYSIHLSERYNQELERTDSAWEALDRAVIGTGGALLGSAATTVGGFGVLAFALLPPLQQFGIITGLTIIYAFLASVLVLPSLLVVWTRYFGPAEKLDVEPPSATGEGTPTDD